VISWNSRVVTVVVLLAGTALFLQARSEQFAPPTVALASFPLEVSHWVGTDVPLLATDLKRLGPGNFLQRTYTNATAEGGDVDLYVAYLSNRSAFYHHLPQDCLAGSGWLPIDSRVTTLSLSADTPFPVNRYLIVRGEERQLVMFWYTAHGHREASETKMDFYLTLDSLRLNRTDNALIRINTELRDEEKPEDAERRLLAFAGEIDPLLKNYIPR